MKNLLYDLCQMVRRNAFFYLKKNNNSKSIQEPSLKKLNIKQQ
jgi:hypothetical protein